MVVVTLNANGFSKDFELPGNEKLGKLYLRILFLLKEKEPRIFGDCYGIIFEINGKGLLDKSSTLFDYGVCTGYELQIVEEEKYHGFVVK